MSAMSSTRVTAKAVRTAVERLHRLRLHRDLTYDELAEELGLSRRNVIRLMTEPGATMRERTLYKVQRYLNTQQSERASA